MFTVLSLTMLQKDSYIGHCVWCLEPRDMLQYSPTYVLLSEIWDFVSDLFLVNLSGQTKLSPVKMPNLPEICLMTGCYLQAALIYNIPHNLFKTMSRCINQVEWTGLWKYSVFLFFHVCHSRRVISFILLSWLIYIKSSDRSRLSHTHVVISLALCFCLFVFSAVLPACAYGKHGSLLLLWLFQGI